MHSYDHFDRVKGFSVVGIQGIGGGRVTERRVRVDFGGGMHEL